MTTSSFYTDGAPNTGVEVAGPSSSAFYVDSDAAANSATQAAASATAAAASASTAAAAATTAIAASAGTATPLVDGTAAVGVSTKWAHEDHVHPTDTSRAAVAYVDAQVATKADAAATTAALALKAPLASPALTGAPTAPTATVGTNTTQIATTAFVLANGASVPPATAAPLMDGTAAVGVATKYAREDHVHPTDTSRAPLASPAFTGTPTAPTAAAGTNTTQVATTAFALSSYPYVNVKSYGAKGDMRFVVDAAMTSGSTTVTSATIAFTSADVGKSVRVAGAGAAGADLYTTVSSVTNGTTAILAASASTPVSSAWIRVATDDTAAIRNAITAAQYGALVFPKGTYFVEELSAAQIFLITKSIRLWGAGGNFEGSWIAVSKRTVSTADYFHYYPGQASVPYFEMGWLCICPEVPDTYVGGASAIYLHSDATSQIQRVHIHDNWINGGASMAILQQDTDVTTSTATFYHSVIERNTLRGGAGDIYMVNCGDSISIHQNNFGNKGYGIYAKHVAGAAQLIISEGNFQGSASGAIFLDACVQATIRNCQIEQGVTQTAGPLGIVTLNNCASCKVTGNNFNAFAQNNCLALAGTTIRACIDNNVFSVANSSLYHIAYTTAAPSGNQNTPFNNDGYTASTLGAVTTHTF